MFATNQATNLRKAYENERKKLISNLSSCGITTLFNGKKTHEATLSELQDEMRFVDLQREGDVVS